MVWLCSNHHGTHQQQGICMITHTELKAYEWMRTKEKVRVTREL